MAINYPTSLDVLTNPAGTNTLDSPDHALQHSEINDIGEILESKVGVGAGSPVAGQALIGSGNGTSTWSDTWNNATFESPTTTGTDAGTATLTNKTLTSPVINTPTGDVATITGTQTLTNKTLTSPKINEDVALTATATQLNEVASLDKLQVVLLSQVFN